MIAHQRWMCFCFAQALTTAPRRTHVMGKRRSRVMASSGTSALPIAPIAVALVAVMLSGSVATQAAQPATAPRLRESSVPAQIPGALGGGEVVLELTVDSRGRVGRVERIRATPPYTDLVADSAAAWQFEPATSMIDGRLTTVAAPVLVVAVFRPRIALWRSGPRRPARNTWCDITAPPQPRFRGHAGISTKRHGERHRPGRDRDEPARGTARLADRGSRIRLRHCGARRCAGLALRCPSSP
jgi:hypothetical protein